MATSLYALGVGPNKKLQPLLSRRSSPNCRRADYEADTTVTYAAQEVELATIPKASVLADELRVWLPSGFGAGTVVTIGTTDGTTFTAFTNGALSASAAATAQFESVDLTDAERAPSATAGKTLAAKFSGTITAQPSAGDQIIMLFEYEELSLDYPDE